MPHNTCFFTAPPLVRLRILHRLGVLTAVAFTVLSLPTLVLAGTGIGVPEANALFTGWHGTIVGVIIPLGAAGVAIGFVARAISNARDGASPVGAVIGAIITAGGAMIIPTLTPATAGGASLFAFMPAPQGYYGPTPALIYGFIVAKLFLRSRLDGRACSE